VGTDDAPVVRDMNKMSRMGGVTAIHHDDERAVTVYSNGVETRDWHLYTSIGNPNRAGVANYQGDTFASYRSLGFPVANRRIRAAVINDELLQLIPPVPARRLRDGNYDPACFSEASMLQ